MFLFQLTELLGLIGLFVQGFVAWVFVVLLAKTMVHRPSPGAYKSFRDAFAMLALSLTIMGVRFFHSHDELAEPWNDGQWQTSTFYSIYMGLKTWFGALLVAGSYQLCTGFEPAWLRKIKWPAIALMSLTPWVLPDINDLLLVQAPLMIAAAWVALRALKNAQSGGSGLRIVRWSLLGLAATWALHASAVVLGDWGPMRYVLSFNSYIDLGVQLTLGTGLLVALLQDAYDKRLEAEREREDLRRTIEKNEKLRALGTVVSGVAHELNNPLTVILGYACELQSELPNDDRPSILVERAEHCRGIVRNLSALAGQAVHPRERIPLAALARRVCRGMPLVDPASTGNLRIEIEEDLEIEVDRIGIEQVLANLIANALHVSPKGQAVTVRATTSGTDVEISVCDAGPGVPEEIRDQIFEPFFTTKAPGEGTGLGLAIAHAIVRGHRGSIRIDSAEGGGAEFCFLLPGALEVSGATPAAAKATPAIPPAGKSGSLLIIDDDPAVRRILREQAMRRGWSVAEASSAEEALATPLEDADAILCDLRMPGIGGIGFHDRLATHHAALLGRLVFLTGDLGSPASAQFAQRCTRPVLHKPVDFDELFSALGVAAAKIDSQGLHAET